jgi:23S rRNA (pseudouridine1915-N3)-methyltransferase
MKIHFRLGWVHGSRVRKYFKNMSCHELFSEYLQRISHFAPCGATGVDLAKKGEGKTKVWFCHASKDSKMFTSEALARELEKCNLSGTSELDIVLGPADGFSKDELALWKPDLMWSFGPMTLPHELASVVAVEQIYRAFTILRNLPYHASH